MASNTRTRWTLPLLAAGVAVAGYVSMTREPTEHPTAATVRPGMTASPMDLPMPAASAGASSSATASTVTPRPAALPAAASTPRVGSEGYGPHIERAQAGSDAAAAWEAVQWLRGCLSTEGRRSSFEALRNQGVSPEMMTQLMVEADAEERRCQTVTPQHHALLPELAARAMRAGVPEAAAAYANATFPNDLTPAQRRQVADAIRRDALSGDAASLLGALTAHEAWGLSDAEKHAYLAAYVSLPGHPEAPALAKALMDQGSIRFKLPPTAEQQAAAKRAGQQIVGRMLTNGQPIQPSQPSQP